MKLAANNQIIARHRREGVSAGDCGLTLVGRRPRRKQLVFAEPHLESHLHKATGATTTREAGETVTQRRRRRERGSTFWSR